MAKSRRATGARTGPRERRVGWWQRPLSWLLVVLACLAAPAAVLAGWARWDLLDADRYVRTVQPLATDPAIQDAVINAANAAFGAGNAGGAASAGENGAAPAAPGAPATPRPRGAGADDRATPVAAVTLDMRTPDAAAGASRPADLPPPPALGERASGATARGAARQVEERAISAAVAATVRSPAFAEEWDAANLAAHAALTDRSAAGQPVAIDLAPLATRAAAALGPGAEAALPDPASMQVVVLDAATADRARAALDRAGWAGVVLPLAAILLIVAAVWVAPSRLAALRRVGFGTVLTTVVALLAILVTTTGVADRLEGPGASIAAAIVDAVLRTPLLWLAILALAGLVAAVLGVAAGWLARDRAAA